MPRTSPGRPRTLTPKEALRRKRACEKRWRQAQGDTYRRAENTKNRARWQSSFQEREAARGLARKHSYRLLRTAATGTTIVRAEHLDRPPLLYIDAKGRVWHEETCSAEELIQRWKNAKKKEGSHAQEAKKDHQRTRRRRTHP